MVRTHAFSVYFLNVFRRRVRHTVDHFVLKEYWNPGSSFCVVFDVGGGRGGGFPLFIVSVALFLAPSFVPSGSLFKERLLVKTYFRHRRFNSEGGRGCLCRYLNVEDNPTWVCQNLILHPRSFLIFIGTF
jgi:hypothetical protein